MTDLTHILARLTHLEDIVLPKATRPGKVDMKAELKKKLVMQQIKKSNKKSS